MADSVNGKDLKQLVGEDDTLPVEGLNATNPDSDGDGPWNDWIGVQNPSTVQLEPGSGSGEI